MSLPNIFTRVFQLFGMGAKSAPTAAPGAYSFDTQALIDHAMYGSLTVTPDQAFRFYRQSSAISTAVDLIASKIEAIEPVLEIDGEIQDRDDVTEFLQKPNNHRMWRQLIGETARNYLLTGNAYFIGIGSIRTRPAEVYTAHPTEAGAVSNVQDGYPESYQYAGMLAPGTYVRQPRGRGQNGVRFVDGPLRELYHLRGYSTRPNAMHGDSPIESILLEIRQHIAGRQHNEAMLRQGGRLSLLFLVKQTLPDPIFKALTERLRAQFGGPQNAGKVAAIAEKELDVKEMGVTNKDMDFVNLDEVTKAAIYGRYNIPLPLITASRQTFSNYAEAVEALYDDAVLPVLGILLEALSDFLLPRFGRDPRREKLTFNPQSILPLRRRMLQELKDAASLNILTINEQREKLPDIGDIEGGDVLLGPATLVPIAGQGIDLAVEHQDDREASEEARQRMEEQLAAGDGPQPPQPGESEGEGAEDDDLEAEE